jgi:hypothetical protein
MEIECELPEEENEKQPEEKVEDKNDADADYLKTLVECEHQAIDQFDKTVLTLAGGAFAVSFAFLKEIVKPETVIHRNWLILAWAFWAASLTCTLSSFYSSHLAMRHAQRQFRRGIRREKNLLGPYGVAIQWLNPTSAVAFIVGLISMSVFVTTNLSHGTEPLKSSTTTQTNAPAASASPAATAASAATNTAPTAPTNSQPPATSH